MNTATACHAWAEEAAKSAELRYWMARRHARSMDCTNPGLPAAITAWDGALEAWETLLSLAINHDSEAVGRLAQWGLGPQVQAVA